MGRNNCFLDWVIQTHVPFTHVDRDNFHEGKLDALPINKPLATKEAHAVNICPRAVTLSHTPLRFLSCYLSQPPLYAHPGPGQVELSTGAVFWMCLHWCGFANIAVRREMRFLCYHYCAEKESHISLWVNASLLCSLRLVSARACLTITKTDR